MESVRHVCQAVQIPLPGVVVVGEQSAGKSSLLENISGIQFPRAQNTCTRMPCDRPNRQRVFCPCFDGFELYRCSLQNASKTCCAWTGFLLVWTFWIFHTSFLVSLFLRKCHVSGEEMCGGGRGGADQGADESAHHGCGLHLHRGPALRVVLAAKPHPTAEPRPFYYSPLQPSTVYDS